MTISEESVQTAQRLHAARHGVYLWRNNSGASVDTRGRLVRYGLCNDSASMNAYIKSADLIGVRPLVITPEMVGHTIGQFVAVECKRGGWMYKGTPREIAQMRFLDLVNHLGGYGIFVATDKNEGYW